MSEGVDWSRLAYLRATIPPGAAGDWILERFEILEPSGLDVRPEWTVSAPGTYTRLRRGKEVFMTDQHDEWWTQRVAIAEACRRGGNILLTGLGLGLVAQSMLETDGSEVDRIDIVEASEAVISLVAPHLLARYGSRIEVHHASAFDWWPPAARHFSVGWHDIWANPQASECEREESVLCERYAPFCDWQGTWSAQWRADEAEARLAR